jgi:hypothetical protein
MSIGLKRFGLWYCGGLNQRALSCRGKHIVGPLFCGGLSPVETFLGEDHVLERGIGLDDDLRNGTLPLRRSVE